MAWVFKNSEGYLGIGFYLDGRLERPYLGGLKEPPQKNKKLAEDIAKKIDAEICLGTFDYARHFPNSKRAKQLKAVAEAHAPQTLGQQARIWLEGRKKEDDDGYTPKVVRDYEYLFRVFLDRTDLGAMNPADVTPRQIVKAITGRSKRRATMFLQRLRSIYRELQGERLVTDNPASLVENPGRRGRKRRNPLAPSEGRKLVDGLTPVEWVAFLNAASGQDRHMTGLGFATGMRPDSELLSVHDTDMNFETNKLIVRGTKNEGAARLIDLNQLPPNLKAEAINAFRAQLQLNADRQRSTKVRWLRDKRAAKTQGGKLLFTNTRGGRINYTNWRGRNWNKIIERAGLAPVGHEGHHTPYAMRHTFTMALVRARVDMETIWKLLGHTGPEMIMRYYARSKPEMAAIQN